MLRKKSLSAVGTKDTYTRLVFQKPEVSRDPTKPPIASNLPGSQSSHRDSSGSQSSQTNSTGSQSSQTNPVVKEPATSSLREHTTYGREKGDQSSTGSSSHDALPVVTGTAPFSLLSQVKHKFFYYEKKNVSCVVANMTF